MKDYSDNVNLPRPSRRRFVQASAAAVATLAAGRSFGAEERLAVSPATTNAGRRWPSELTVRKDPVSGATVRQLHQLPGAQQPLLLHLSLLVRPGPQAGHRLGPRESREPVRRGLGVGRADAADRLGSGQGVESAFAQQEPGARGDRASSTTTRSASLDLATLQSRPLMKRPPGYTGNLRRLHGRRQVRGAPASPRICPTASRWTCSTATSASTRSGRPSRTRRSGRFRWTAASRNGLRGALLAGTLQRLAQAARTSSPSATRARGTRSTTASGVWT